MEEIKDIANAPGHWILAKMGKKVLRPGGKALTTKLVEQLNITPEDDVVEFTPGLGFTTRLVIAKKPNSYIGIDINASVVKQLSKRFNASGCTFLEGNAANSGLNDQSCDKIYGEAMLTMHADHRKAEIIREAYRILRPGGYYAIHELGLTPDTIDVQRKADIQKDLARSIRVNARPLTVTEWLVLLENEGFKVKTSVTSPMHLLEPGRMVDDEGLLNTLKIAFNILRNRKAFRRILEMQRVFRKYQQDMNAIMMVAQKQ